MRSKRTTMAVGLIAFASGCVYADTPQRNEALVRGEQDPPYDMPVRMPSLMLLSAEADDVGKYRMSLRKTAADARPPGPARP